MSSVNKNAMIIAGFAGLLLLSSIAAIFYMGHKARRGSYALIYQNNELVCTVKLTGAEQDTITIEGKDGAYNVLEIRDGAIGIVDASCPDRLCERMGFISDSLMPITCLPNHLIVQVTDDGRAPDGVDGVAY